MRRRAETSRLLAADRGRNEFKKTPAIILDMLDATATRSHRRPRFRRTDEAPSFQLTERDIEIVRQVAQHRFLRSIHLSQLLDAPHHKIRERLTSLFHAGYLDRPRSQLEY